MAEAASRTTRNPRHAAVLAVADVLAGRSLSESLPKHCSGLVGRERSLAFDLAFGACRWKLRFDGLLQRVMDRPLRARDRDIAALLLCGAYQLLHTRIPAHAAVGESAHVTTVLGKRWATGLVNGVLRRIQRESQQLMVDLDRDPVTEFALPDWLIGALKETWPADWRRVCRTMNEHPPMTLRVNRQRISAIGYRATLAELGMQAYSVSGLPSALCLENPVDVTRLPGFDQGLVSVQDAGAQWAAPLLDVRPGQRVLDACAAPGGKSCHLLELCPDIELTALDVNGRRVKRIFDNLQRLRLKARVLIGDALQPAYWWDGLSYDRVLLDVPCSATGVIRRHPDIRLLRRAADIAAMASLQDAMLESVWPLLRAGGRLLYVTCSLLSAENAERVTAFVARHRDARAICCSIFHGRPVQLGCQLLPQPQGNDGFFYTLLSKEEQ